MQVSQIDLSAKEKAIPPRLFSKLPRGDHQAYTN